MEKKPTSSFKSVFSSLKLERLQLIIEKVRMEQIGIAACDTWFCAGHNKRGDKH